MKIKVILQTEKLYQKIEKAIENLIHLESESPHDVDIGKCIDDYITALLIFDQTLFKTEIV